MVKSPIRKNLSKKRLTMAVRKALSKLEGRHTFTAKIADFSSCIVWNSSNNNSVKDTILLSAVKCNSKDMTNHLWVDAKEFLKVGATLKDNVMFTAVVCSYEKYHRGQAFPNFALTDIQEVQIIDN